MNVALLVGEVVEVLFTYWIVFYIVSKSKILNHLIFDIIGLAIYRANLTIPDLIICIHLLQTNHTLLQPLLSPLLFMNNNHIQIRPVKRVNHHLSITNNNLPHLITNVTLNTKILKQRLIHRL